jgi:hypothetical protein
LFKLTAATADGSISLKMRKAGVDTSASYYMGGYQVDFSGSAGNRTTNNSSSFPLGNIDTSNPTNGNSYDLTFFNPNTTTFTNFTSIGFGQETNGSVFWVSLAGNNIAATQFDGFSLIVSSGAISGTITTYGFKD